MTKNTLARPLKAALLGAVLSVPALTSSAFADTKNYQFQLVQQEAKVGDAVLAVRLVDKRSGKPVTDAVVFAKRLDMAPDAMEEMATKVEQVPSTEPASTASRPISECRAAGACRWPRRSRARPARSRTS